MGNNRTLNFLEKLMAGHQMSSDDLDALLQEKVQEDLFLEYKHGDELQESRKASQALRQYLSGFANSAGGALIIGVDQQNWTVTGCTAPGGGDLAEWASRCLTPIAPYFSPPPRFQVVKHPQGDVLIASTDRSLGLVPCIESGEMVYYLRFHDQTLDNKTLKVPDYLVSDIVLGRRRFPYLDIANFSISNLGRHGTTTYCLSFSPVFVVENKSLSWAEDVRVGIISWTSNSIGNPSLISNFLLSYIQINEPDRQKYQKYFEYFHKSHTMVGIKKIEPFEVGNLKNVVAHMVPLRINSDWFIPYVWKAAVYLMAKDTPPVWYQLKVAITDELLKLSIDTPLSSLPDKFFEIQRLTSERPVVEWEQM
jgi:hypothetical protein